MPQRATASPAFGTFGGASGQGAAPPATVAPVRTARVRQEPVIPIPVPRAAPSPAGAYRHALAWAFAVFNSLRVASYLPTFWAIHQSGDSSQHSLWTWACWLGANATMAAWLHAEHGMNRAAVMSAANAAMCLAGMLLIAAYRFA